MSAALFIQNPAMSLPSRCCFGSKVEKMADTSLERWIECDWCKRKLVVHAEIKHRKKLFLAMGCWPWRFVTQETPYNDYFLAPKE